jgi:hypothetical protein
MGAHKTQRMASAFVDFLERYLKDSDEFLSHIIRVNLGFHLWMLKPKSNQSSGYTHTPNKPKKFKQITYACQKADGNSFLVQEMSADGGIHATRNHSNARSVLQNTKKRWNTDIRCSAPEWQCASA